MRGHASQQIEKEGERKRERESKGRGNGNKKWKRERNARLNVPTVQSVELILLFMRACVRGPEKKVVGEDIEKVRDRDGDGNSKSGGRAGVGEQQCRKQSE